MKKQKLMLNKETVADLGYREMNEANGGTGGGTMNPTCPVTSTATLWDTCATCG
jgi:hypothetical protein